MRHIVEVIEHLSRIESASLDVPGLTHCAEALATYVTEATGAEAQWLFGGEERRPHLRFDFGARSDVLLVGHFDIHYEPGVLEHFPVVREGSRLYGPGVLDMKQGLVLMVEAVRFIQQTSGANPNLTLFFNSDEEIASITSRSLLREFASDLHAALAFEFSTREFLPKFSARGVRQLEVTIKGRGGHSGYAHEHVNPVFALQDLLTVAQEMSDFDAGLLVTPTMIDDVGGHISAVPDAVVVYIDIRGKTDELLDAAVERLHALEFSHPEVTFEVTQKLQAPALPPRDGNRVKQYLSGAVAELDLPHPGFHEARGVSDVNYIGDLLSNVAEGFSGWGEGAHQPTGEYVDLDSLGYAGPVAAVTVQHALRDAIAERGES
jgi:glutamate carboxypeptidase